VGQQLLLLLLPPPRALLSNVAFPHLILEAGFGTVFPYSILVK
jgi:hypothetical protein